MMRPLFRRMDSAVLMLTFCSDAYLLMRVSRLPRRRAIVVAVIMARMNQARPITPTH